MKRNTAYFIISGVVFLLFIGVFIYMSTSTYSIYDVTSASIDNISIPINGTKTIDVAFELYNSSIMNGNNDEYHLEWSVNSDSVILGNTTTYLNNSSNSITAISLGNNIVVTVDLYYREIKISTDTASVSVFNINNINFTNVSDSTNYSINISKKNERMILPNEYSSNTIQWQSSDENVLTVNSTGVINPLSAGIATVTATIYDSENNIIAKAVQAISIVANTNRDTISGEGESGDYSLKSISINGKANILEGNTKDYNVSLGDESSFKINAVANNGGTVKIINFEDDKVYNNNESIPWKIGSPNMAVYVCVVNGNNECIDTNYKYQIILEKSNASSSANSDGYLANLTIGSDKIIENGQIVGEYSIDCDDEGNDDVFFCKINYTAKAGTKELNISVTPKSEYAVEDGITNPVVVQEGTNEEYFTLIHAGDSSKVVCCLYEINIIVPKDSNAGTNTPTQKTTSPNGTSNPGTGDISSFIIFMIMLLSLIASLFVYKKKIGNN